MKQITRKCQRGSVLIISLLFLLILTILGLSSARSSVLQERMAFNTREQTLAFQAAEAALRDAELWLHSLKGNSEPPKPQSSCTSDCYSVPVWTASTPDSNIIDKSHTWWASKGRQHGQALDGTDTDNLSTSLHAEQPYYLIQEINASSMANNMPGTLTQGYQYGTSGPYFYRIVAYGVGKTTYTEGSTTRHFDVQLESLYAIPAF